jgi:hypothetical protein
MQCGPNPALIRKFSIKVGVRVQADPHMAYELWRSAKKEFKTPMLPFRP